MQLFLDYFSSSSASMSIINGYIKLTHISSKLINNNVFILMILGLCVHVDKPPLFFCTSHFDRRKFRLLWQPHTRLAWQELVPSHQSLLWRWESKNQVPPYEEAILFFSLSTDFLLLVSRAIATMIIRTPTAATIQWWAITKDLELPGTAIEIVIVLLSIPLSLEGDCIWLSCVHYLFYVYLMIIKKKDLES